MKFLSVRFPGLFSQFFSYFFPLALFFVLPVGASAQIAGRASNYKLNFAGEEKIAAATTRPRVITEKPLKSAAPISAAALHDLEQRAFELINEQRAAQNLTPLKWSEDVARVARTHSQNMAEYKFLSHQGTDGSMVDNRADRIGLSKWKAIGENIAYNRGYEQPIEFAVERWMQSPKHKQNLLDPRWQESAIGIAVTPDGTYYLTQVFLLRK